MSNVQKMQLATERDQARLELIALRAERAALEAALELEHEETNRLRDLAFALRAERAKPTPSDAERGNDYNRTTDLVSRWYSEGGMRARLIEDIFAAFASIRAEGTLVEHEERETVERALNEIITTRTAERDSARSEECEAIAAWLDESDIPACKALASAVRRRLSHSIRAEGSAERAKLEAALREIERGKASLVPDELVPHMQAIARRALSGLSAHPSEAGQIINWLRRQANAENDGVKRQVFIEAHNAAMQIAQPAKSGATELRKMAADFLGACPTCGAIDEPQCITIGCSDSGAKP